MQEFYAIGLDGDKPWNAADHRILAVKDDAAAARAINDGALGGEGVILYPSSVEAGLLTVGIAKVGAGGGGNLLSVAVFALAFWAGAAAAGVCGVTVEMTCDPPLEIIIAF